MPSFVSRIVVMVVDGAIVLALAALSFACTYFAYYYRAIDVSGIAFLAWLLLTWLYLVVLKRSDVRTVAYRLLGLKIVSTSGVRPSILMMTLRMAMWLIGPFNFVLDLIWLGADTERQSLRDCYAGTYVVRNTAKPIGSGPIHLTRFLGGGFALTYPRVVRPLQHRED